MFFIGTLLWGGRSQVDKDCGDHTIYNPYSYIYNIRFQQRTKMPILDWVFDNISKTVKDVSDDIKDVSFVRPPQQEPEPEVFNISLIYTLTTTPNPYARLTTQV
jgi:hypothetical protein